MWKIQFVGLLMVAAVVSCAEGREPLPTSDDGAWVEINYRGQKMWAQRQGALLVIEGDILVYPADVGLDRVESQNGIEERRGELAREVGFGFKWPDGFLLYSLANVATADQALVESGVNLWRTVVPGLRFDQVPGACTGDCLNFTTVPNVNRSFVGRQGGAQVVMVQNAPPPAIVAHEIAHALGTWHEMQRGDRNAFVQITWANVTGCVNGATSFANCGPGPCEAGPGTPVQNAVNNGCCTMAQFNAMPQQCYQAPNFDVSSAVPQALMFGYDYDSVMHYPANGFSKSGATTVTTLQTPPPGVVIGQRTHLSTIDIASVNVLYPARRHPPVLFRNTGVQRVVWLGGRDQDIDVRFSCAVGTLNTTQTVNTALLTEGPSTTTCTVNSVFWALDYAYPNTTDTRWPNNGIESFTGSSPVMVLNPGLITVFQTTPVL